MTANVYILQSNYIYDNKFSYLIPKEMEKDIYNGVIVTVPFGNGNRTLQAAVWDVCDTNESKYILKEIKSIEENILPLNKNDIELCEKIHDEYFCTMGDVIKCLIPPPAGEGKTNVAILSKSVEEIKEAIQSGVFTRINQIKVLEILCEGPMPVNEIIKGLGTSASVINTLKKNGYIEVTKERVTKENKVIKAIAGDIPHILNDEQEHVYNNVSNLLDKKEFAEVLLFGVTGSGKTEVYLHLISKVMDKGGNAILLVPEISLTPQTVDRLTGRFGSKVAVLHSRLSERERNTEWNRIRNGEVNVAVGARSCIFAPFNDISLFIIDEEQESTYKSDEQSPRYHASEVAVMRAKMHNSIVIYGSATPRVETYYRAMQKEIYMYRLSKRANKGDLPPVEIVDMRNENRIGDNIFSSKLLSEMKKNYEARQQTILFINRRGFSSQMICISCGKTLKCKRCNIPLTYHQKSDRLICHYCGNTIVAPKKCPVCGSISFNKKGVGTEKIETAIKKYFPESNIVRMDTDTTTGKNGHQKLIEQFRDEKADFLVGTQMIAKGHDFPLVTLVGVISADSLLNMQDYRAQERAFQLLTQVSGRAGRDKLPGRVIIQAYNVDDYALVSASMQDYEKFYGNEIIIRKQLLYPPFCSLGVVSFSGPVDKTVYDFASMHLSLMRQLNKSENMDVLGPTRNSIPKINDKYRWRIIIKSIDGNELKQYIKEYLNNIHSVKKYINKDILVSTDINPGFMI